MKVLAILMGLALLAPAEEKQTKKDFPDFVLKTLKGEAVKFSELTKDKITVVNFWSCKCPWSRAWDPALVKIHQEYKDRVKFVNIDSNVTESNDQVKAYMEEKKIPFEVYRDENAKVADLFKAKTTPHIYLINKKGKVVYKGAIDNDARGKKAAEDRVHYLKNAIEAVLAGKAPEKAETKPVGCTIKRPKT